MNSNCREIISVKVPVKAFIFRNRIRYLCNYIQQSVRRCLIRPFDLADQLITFSRRRANNQPERSSWGGINIRHSWRYR